MGQRLRRWGLVLAFSLFTSGLVEALAAPAALAAEPEAFARITVDAADLRTGPGVSFRVIYTAHRGETLALDGRPGTGFWLRVILPDGRTAYALGDELQTFAVDAREKGAPSRPGVLAPPPLTGARGGLAILGGAAYVPLETGGMHAYGYIEARPSLVLDRTISIDGFVGDVLTSNGKEILYGVSTSVYFAPSWPLCPFLDLGGGGMSIFPNSDSFVLQRADYYLARAGGGLLLAFRTRIMVRLEATNLTIFNAQTYKNAQTFAGGLGVYFLKASIMCVHPMRRILHACARALVVSSVAVGLASSTACVTVRPQQRAVLADPVMQFDSEAHAEALRTHAIDNREGSFGGSGVAGGGCGCN